MKWFTLGWWQYLLEKPLSWRKFWCRVGNHKDGPVYYDLQGTEPNWSCRNCGDYLG